MSEWIKVEDRLPEKYDFVLVCMTYQDGEQLITVGCHTSVSDNWYIDGDIMQKDIERGEAWVTHWMELPQLPSEENDGT